MKNAEKGINTLFGALDMFCRLSLVFMSVVVFAQVFVREFLNFNIRWAEEVVLLLQVWITFAALAIGVKEETHIRIDFFVSRFSKPIRKGLVIFNDVFLLCVSLSMIYYGIELIKFTDISKMPVTGMSAATVFYFIPFTAVFSVVACIAKLCGLYQSDNTRYFIEGTFDDPTKEVIEEIAPSTEEVVKNTVVEEVKEVKEVVENTVVEEEKEV